MVFDGLIAFVLHVPTMHPNVLILLCILLWGIWGITSKLSNMHNSPAFVTLVTNVLYALLSIPLLFKIKSEETPVNWGFSALVWILLTGAVGVSAKLIFNMALNKAPASQVIPATAIFPLVTVLLGFIFFKERLTFSQGIGMLFCIGGTYLLTAGK